MKDKRKTRLNKTQVTNTEFVGFGAFADATPSGDSSPPKQRWSPVYTGKDSHLASLVFPRLIKRDATTKVKALQELQEYFRQEDHPKKKQVDALAHYFFLYHSKLSYESSSSVRAEAVLVLTLAALRVPKAFSTLVQQNNRQVLGMMYCCHGDPAAEVRTVATKNISSEDNAAFSLKEMEFGLWHYVQLILSYGRANKMQEDLFATSWKSSNGNGGSTTEDLNELQKDQLEERFERIVGTALAGMQVWMQRHGIVSVYNSHNFLWKTLSSPKSSLRHNTYSLLAICCQKAPNIILDNQQAFSQTLPHALSSEKEPGNIAALLEALLAFLAAYSKHHAAGSGASPWDNCLNATAVTKSLVKIFKKSCFGASATHWGPSLLPLLAMLPSLSDQVAVLSAAWKGREETVRLGDDLVVMQTVSESASFFLLRKQKEESQAEEEQAKELAQLWMDCLQNFLRTTVNKSKAGPLQQAQTALSKGLAKEMRQFDEERANCAFYPMRDWLWKEQVREAILNAQGYEALAMLVQEVNLLNTEEPLTSSHLSSILSEKFSEVLSAFQDRSGAVPTVDAYDLMIAILQCCGIHVLENTDGENQANKMSAENFLANDLLRWMVIHTSSLSTQHQTKALTQKDFILFGICATGLQSEEERSKLWETLLREVIAAKCRLDLLLAGFTTLLQQDRTWAEKMQCDLLDQFAIQVVGDSLGSEATDEKPTDGSDSEDDGMDNLKQFLQKIAGLHAGIPSLVRQSVVRTWVDMTCGADDGDIPVPGSVLETLTALSAAPSPLSDGEIHRVVLQCWRQGGHAWDMDAMDLLAKESGHLLALFNQAPEVLKTTLVEWSSKPGDANANSVAILWSERALRLVAQSRRSTSSIPVPSLNLVSLGEMSLWESRSGCDFPFSCLMRLLGDTASPLLRLQLLQQSGGNNATEFIVSILLSLSGASSEGIAAASTSQQKDRAAQLLSALGGRSHLGKHLLEHWLKACVARIAQFIEKGETREIQKGVAVVAKLCGLMIDRIEAVDVLSADDDDDDDHEEFQRENIAKMIMPVLGKQVLSALPWSSCLAELLNVVVFHCGVGIERGIGSLHYDIFQLVLGAENRLIDQLNLDDVKEEIAIQELWLLALSCGFGLNTPFSEWNSLLAFEPDKITAPILDYYDKQERATGGSRSDLGRAVLAWLITASPTLKDKDLQSRALKHMYKDCIAALSTNSSFDEDTLLALRGIHVAQVVSKRNNVDVANLGTQALMRLVGGFSSSSTWENSRTQRGVIGQAFDATCHPVLSIQPVWRDLSRFNDIISFALAQTGDLLVSATSDFVDDLVSCLFVSSKRWYAFRMLTAIARSTQVLGDPTPEADTAQRLSAWTEDLDEQAKEELAEDVEIVCEILPHRLMTKMESWHEEEYSDTLDDQIIIGRMLVWLCCLHFIDAFVGKDPSNRPSLCAYIDKCGAAECILNQTLLHTGVGTEKISTVANPPIDMDQLLETESLMEKVPLASLILFRTVETLPPLSRRWWEHECPKVYEGPIRDYIEAQVAPKILEKELERLKLATIKNPALSALTVTGSVTTREITASYTQDEIKLKVSIVLPSFYPLRNAEVDCSQTLGIPPKRWKLWSLQITMMLNNQGGTLQEALMLWKENVDQEFEGVEACPICYSVLHVKTHKLPELECTTCSNRFHTQCLTQWFRNSGKNQCVICQQSWAGTKVKR